MLSYEQACDMVRRVRIKAGHFEKVAVLTTKEIYGDEFGPVGAPLLAGRREDGLVAIGILPNIDDRISLSEVEAMIAHEFGHIVNGDLLVMGEVSDEEALKCEYAADLFAVSLGYGRALKSAFEKCLPTHVPDPKHPPLLDRINRIQYALVELEDQKKAA